MIGLDAISQEVQRFLEDKNQARDRALLQCRRLVRHCATAIRAVHRREWEAGDEQLRAAIVLVEQIRQGLVSYPDLYHAGYAWDGRKEFAEASITYALIRGMPLPDPQELGVEYDAYVAGMGEAAGELRRHTLDLLRQDNLEEAERMLADIDDIYGLLVTLDYPDAITGNLRRITDMVRGVAERTRGDLTTSVQQRELRIALQAVERKVKPPDA